MLLTKLGPELQILQHFPLEEIENIGGALLAEAIRRMRLCEIKTAAGYDGEYGIIKVFDDREMETFSTQLGFFPSEEKTDEQVPLTEQPLSVSDATEAEEYGVATPAKEMTQETMDVQAVVKSAEYVTGSTKEREIALAEHPILSDLNPEQKEAVQCTEVSLIIVAGPGTGKTRTLTHRMAYLVTEQGVSPENLLAVTFTNKAAEEMTERLNNLVDPKVASQVTLKTFHALGAMILRAEGERIGLQTHFAICSEQDRKLFLKRFCGIFNDGEIKQYLDKISSAKNQLLSPEDCAVMDEFKDEPEFINIYQNYELALAKNQVLDFDDLIARTVGLFEQHPDVLQKYQNRFRWISVDEYQDINFAQYRLLRLLTAPEVNLCVIGDPDQAIYGFRGAKREFFLKFQQDFPDAKIVHLKRNYRSTQLILNASEQIIAKSASGRNIEIWSEIVSKTKVEIYPASTYKAEAEYVVHQIEKMLGGTSYFSLDSGRVGSEDEANSRSFSDFAVLYRLGAQNRILEEAFRRSGIPYQTVGDTPFFERKEIQAVLSYLWFLHNPDSIFHVQKIFTHFKSGTGIGTLYQIAQFAEEREMSLWAGLQKYEELDFLDTSQKNALDKIVPILQELKKAAETQSVSQLIGLIQNYTESKKSSQANEKHFERLQQLVLKARPFGNRLQDFLESTVLRRATDEYDPRADRVTLMTLHASKGLEFPVVFIVGCEENLIPYRRQGQSTDIEEERRLLYVGMTRAQEKLILTHAKTRLLFGQKCQNAPSRFLSDIEDALKEMKMMEFRTPKKGKKNKDQMRLF
jgi:DNA helicase-2/ATP-dependent DNA helicase PcrA